MSSKKNISPKAPTPSKKVVKATKPVLKRSPVAARVTPPVRLASARGVGAPQSSLPRNPTDRRLTSGPQGVGLSSAAMLYAKAMCNPFGEFEELPCVPASPPAETYRYRAIQRFSFSTGTSGYGFVAMDPTQPANDQYYAYYTDSTFTGTGFQAGGSISIPNSKLPFNNAAFNGSGVSTLTYRLVGAGLRIRNTTQALNVGGVLLGIRLPGDEEDSLLGYSFPDVSTSPYTVMLSSTLDKQSDWKNLIWVPTATAQLGLNAAAPSTYFVPTLGFLVQAPSPSVPQTFEVETVQFFEFAGQYENGGSQVVLPSVEVSYSDSVGLDRVLHGATYLVPALSTDENVTNLSSGIVEAFAHSDSTAKTVEDLLGSVGKSLISAAKLAGTLVKWLAI